MGKLDKKVAIVTGGGQGNGRGVALAFAREGARIAVADIKPERAKSVVNELQAIGVPAIGVACNVGLFEDVKNMVGEVANHFGTIDILVNNAQSGNRESPTHLPEPIENLPEEWWDLSFNTGPKGTWYCSKAVFPYMKKQGRGKIINFGSIGGMRGTEFAAAYNAAKEAIRAFSRTAAREWGKYGINVNVICPIARTPALIGSIDRPEGDYIKDFLKTLPISRLGDPEKDIGRTAVFLASEDSDFITGQTINVDGGAWMF